MFDTINQRLHQLVLQYTLGKGVAEQARAFRRGFDTIFPLADLDCFEPAELPILVGEVPVDWSEEGE